MSEFKIINGNDLIHIASMDVINPPKGIKIDGWNKFNDYLGGLRENEFTIFCGGTGIGKTQWLAAWLVKQGVKTFVAPVETGHVDLMRRIFSIYGHFDFNAADEPTSDMKSNLKFVIQQNMDNINNNLYVSTYDNRVDVNEMILTLKMVHEKHGVQVAVLDNLNFFMKPTSASNQILEYDEVIHNFVMLAKKLPMHVILVMHPKKTTGKIVSEFDIKGSSTAVQEATNILIMNRLSEDEWENGLTAFHREFTFLKIRRRGFYVGRKFYMHSEHGKYIDHQTGGVFTLRKT